MYKLPLEKSKGPWKKGKNHNIGDTVYYRGVKHNILGIRDGKVKLGNNTQSAWNNQEIDIKDRKLKNDTQHNNEKRKYSMNIAKEHAKNALKERSPESYYKKYGE